MVLFNTVNEDSKYTSNIGYLAYNHERYVEGFFHAAMTLVDNWHDGDWMIYPLFFTYRHMIELNLKQSIRLCQLKHNREVITKKKIRDTHDLKELWDKLGEIGAEYFRMQGETELVQTVIMEINDYDRGSRFRYADHQHDSSTIDVKKIARLMNDVHHFFLNITEDITHFLREQGRLDELREVGNDPRLFVDDFEDISLDPNPPTIET